MFTATKLGEVVRMYSSGTEQFSHYNNNYNESSLFKPEGVKYVFILRNDETLFNYYCPSGDYKPSVSS